MRLIAAGAEHRILPTLPAKMVIIDRAIVMTPIDPEDPLKGVWQITAKPLVRALVEMYQRLWGQAVIRKSSMVAGATTIKPLGDRCRGANEWPNSPIHHSRGQRCPSGHGKVVADFR